MKKKKWNYYYPAVWSRCICLKVINSSVITLSYDFDTTKLCFLLLNRDFLGSMSSLWSKKIVELIYRIFEVEQTFEPLICMRCISGNTCVLRDRYLLSRPFTYGLLPPVFTPSGFPPSIFSLPGLSHPVFILLVFPTLGLFSTSSFFPQSLSTRCFPP